MTPYALERGAGDATVALLHGFAGSHRDWSDVLPMTGGGVRVLAYDLPGHGASLALAEAAAPRRAAAALNADLAARGLRRVHLAGHSMGGAIAVLMALEQPERVASLTLLAPGGFGPEINARLLRRFAAARDADSLRACLEAMQGWDCPVTDDAVAEAVELRALAGQGAALAALVERITPGGRQGTIPREALDGLAMPVSVVWGERDNVVPASHAERLPARFALHRLAGIGHMLPREAPDFVDGIILRTLAAGR